MVNVGEYKLATKANRNVVGRKKQLDKGACRQTWKHHDPLSCVASVAFRKHGTWMQTWTWHFRSIPADSADPSTTVIGVSIWQ